jgi:hypothetical protein
MVIIFMLSFLYIVSIIAIIFAIWFMVIEIRSIHNEENK